MYYIRDIQIIFLTEKQFNRGEFTDITVGGNDEIIDNRWIEWDHFAIPNKPIWFRKIMRKLMAALNHCLVCTSLDACYFLGRKAPNFPLHHNCDCKIKRILHNKVKNKGQAEMAIEKFTKYVFAENGIKNGKNQIFYYLGYTIDNANDLLEVFKIQALNNYLNGNYILKSLDKYGQRIAVSIKLKNKEFYSGWLVEPEGKIRNTTPFGGWKE